MYKTNQGNTLWNNGGGGARENEHELAWGSGFIGVEGGHLGFHCLAVYVKFKT